MLSWIKGDGIEAGGAVYDWDGKKVNAGGVTTFQRHAVVSENRLTLVPTGMAMDVAVLLGCAAPTGMGAVFNVLNVKAGDSVAVFGTGGIGLNAIMAAAFVGGIPIIGVDPNAVAPRSGADLRRDPRHRSGGGRCARAQIKQSCRRASMSPSKRPESRCDGAGCQRHPAAGRPRGRHRQRAPWRRLHPQSRRSSTRARA